MIEFLAENYRYIVGLHLLGAGIGVGAATISDILFFRLLKDFMISKKEQDILETLSKVIWLALFVIVISGLGLYLPNAEAYNQSDKFLLKMTVVGILVVNGVFLSRIVGRRLIEIFPAQGRSPRSLRRLAFMGGAISITSWYSSFILGLIKQPNFTYGEGLAGYVIIVLGAIGASQIMEQLFHRKRNRS